MTPITILLACGGIALLMAFHTYCTKVYADIRAKDEAATNSISTPPEYPKVTPPVIVEQVQLGVGTYQSVDEPEVFVSVRCVERGVVYFDISDKAYLGTLNTLPVAVFLVKYTPRTQTSISKL